MINEAKKVAICRQNMKQMSAVLDCILSKMDVCLDVDLKAINLIKGDLTHLTHLNAFNIDEMQEVGQSFLMEAVA